MPKGKQRPRARLVARWRRRALVALGGAACMMANPLLSSLPSLDTDGGKLDQRLEERSNVTLTATGMPDSLPCLVRFPVIAMVEQVDSQQIGMALFRIGLFQWRAFVGRLRNGCRRDALRAREVKK